MNAKGIVNIPSVHPVVETADRLQSLLGAEGIEIFARINPKVEAHDVGPLMQDTELLIDLRASESKNTPHVEINGGGAGSSGESAGVGISKRQSVAQL
jgi:hypothetical protein